METMYERTELLLGSEGVKRLKNARVAVFGVGGVGGFTVEALARAGVGELDLIDNDEVVLSNLNRQIIATVDSVGRPKADVAAERVLSINPSCKVHAHRVFYLPETAAQFDFAAYDYVVDAIDTVTGKLMLAEQAKAAGTPIISAMGAGNKLDPTAFKVADISKTKVCPLAKVMRRELKKRGIEHLKVVYSEEMPLTPGWEAGAGQTPASAPDAEGKPQEGRRMRQTPGSVSFVPSVVGLIIAGEVIKDICGAKG